MRKPTGVTMCNRFLLVCNARQCVAARLHPVSTIKKPVRYTCRQAFTLVELLTIIAIISMLVGLLFPALSQARERGRRINCLSNLRQLSIAMNLYADDNKGRLPAPFYHVEKGGGANGSVTAPDSGGPADSGASTH